MKKHYQVVIPAIAKESLRDIISHIKKESPVAAIKVRKALIRLAKSLNESPERFSKKSTFQINLGIAVQWHVGITKSFIKY